MANTGVAGEDGIAIYVQAELMICSHGAQFDMLVVIRGVG